MSTWTAADMPDCGGMRAIVTGANRGLGFHVALELARHGAQVTLACRNDERAEQALRRIRAEVPGAEVERGDLDLADLKSVRKFAEDYTAGNGRLDLLINNAGVMALPQRSTADGFELQLGTNHLGHFALTGMLLPLLCARPGSRVVTVTSLAHRRGRIRFGNLHGRFRYQRWSAYNQSKLANAVFAVELQRRLERAGFPVLSVAAHPGFAATDLALVGPRMEERRATEAVFRLTRATIAQSAASGALPLLFAATAAQVGGARFYGPRGLGQMRGRPGEVGLASHVSDTALGRQLWDLSERLTDVKYDFTTAALHSPVLTTTVPLPRRAPDHSDTQPVLPRLSGEATGGEARSRRLLG